MWGGETCDQQRALECDSLPSGLGTVTYCCLKLYPGLLESSTLALLETGCGWSEGRQRAGREAVEGCDQDVTD